MTNLQNIDAAWGAATADVGNLSGESNPPAPGTYTVRVSDARGGQSKKGELYFSVTYALPSGQTWDEVKMLTTGGQLVDGKAKAAKILLNGLGLGHLLPSQLDQVKTVINRHYRVEVKQSSTVNTNTGEFYVNTDVLGAVDGPANPNGTTAVAPAPIVSQAQAAPTTVQTPTGMATIAQAIAEQQATGQVANPPPAADPIADGADHPLG